jgi:hypothetical protein
LVVIVHGHSAFAVAVVPLIGCSIAISAFYKRTSCLLGVYLAILCWWMILPPMLAPTEQGESPFLGLADAIRTMFLVVGLLLAAAGHAVGAWLRPSRDWLPLRWIAIAGGLASVAFVVVTLAFVTPARSSFEVTLPSGWTTLSETTGRYLPYCRDFAAVEGSVDFLEEEPTVPALCGVAEKLTRLPDETDANVGDAEWCYHVFDHEGPTVDPLDQWSQRASPPSPAISGAHEEIRVSQSGTVVYGLGLERTREVGPTQEQVCYVVVVTVPKGWPMTEADVNGILSTFRFR